MNLISKLRHSLSFRIFLSMFLVASFSSILAGGVSVYLGFYVIREDIKTALLQSGIELQRLAADFREDQEQERWRQLQEDFLPHRVGRLLRLLDGHRNTIFSNFRGDRNTRLIQQMDRAGTEELVFLRTDSGGYVLWKSAFRTKSGQPRELQVALPLPLSNQILQKSFVYFFPAMLLTILLVVLATMALSRRLLRPVSSVAYHLGSLRERDVREWTLIPVKAESEFFGTIINKVNDLIGLVQESDVFRQNWARSVAHEIRTPLMLMHGELETFDVDSASKEDIQVFHKQLTSDIMRAESIIKTVLALGKRSNHDGVRLKSVNLVNNLQRAVQDFRKAFQLDIQLNVDPSISQNEETRIDWDLLRMLLDNLIRNILFHAGTRSKASISLQSDDRSFTIIVQDNGKGMPDSVLKILDNWKSWDSHLGVGLNLCKQIESLSGWTLNFQSENNLGCRVQVRIPRIDSEA